jgi:hypothetical protein
MGQDELQATRQQLKAAGLLNADIDVHFTRRLQALPSQSAQTGLTGVSDQQLMQLARKFNPRGPTPDTARNSAVWEEVKRRQQLAR